LLALEHELASGYYHSLVGQELDVLVEGEEPNRPGFVRGTSCRSAPVVLEGHGPALIGRRVVVRVDSVGRGFLNGSPVAGYPWASLPNRPLFPPRRFPLPQIGELNFQPI
jgi:tRNA A37 methylthiotransferase MiaB